MNQSKDNISVFLLVRTVDEDVYEAVFWSVDESVCWVVDCVDRAVSIPVHMAVNLAVDRDRR